MSPHFFIHIPKTAGTSFRLAVESRFGSSALVNDYGRESSSTSELVREHLYGDAPDPWRFYQACEQQGVTMLGGHVPARRFVPGVGAGKTVVFLRDPLARLLSDYRHFVRHYGYEGSFRSFFCKPAMINRQMSFLAGVPLEALGVVGLTERYPESLELVNAAYGWSLAERKDNRAPESASELAISPDDREELVKLNARDLALYRAAEQAFRSRWDLFSRGEPFVHGHIQKAQGRVVAGWAWWGGASQAPVDVELLVNDRPTGLRQTPRPFPQSQTGALP